MDNFLLVTLGTGVGGGIVIGGKLSAAARTASAPRSATSRSIPTARCARAGSAATGRRWRRAPRSVRWAASARRRATAPIAARARERQRRTPSRACWSATPRKRRRRRARDRRATTRSRSRSGWSGWPTSSIPRWSLVSGGLVELGGVLLDPLRAWFAGHIEGARYRPTVEIVPARARRRSRAWWAQRCWRAPSTRDAALSVTLPSFRDEIDPVLAVATAAEAAGLDAVFALRPPLPPWRRTAPGALRSRCSR